MKIEKLNDFQIKCTLTSDDLIRRNLNLRELSYGSEKVRALFKEMIEKASEEVGFDPEDFPLTIEAIPYGNQGLVLLVTKVETPDELNARYARFSPPLNAEHNPLEDVFALIQQGVPGVQGNNGRQTLVSDSASGINRAFVFSSLDKVIEAANALVGGYNGKNSLYKKPQTKEFYLYLQDGGDDPMLYASTCNVLSEYASVSTHNDLGLSYMNEHFELIIKDNALSALARV
ncbi:MAG: adaptor protein MecA [Lachnospiraceae bacterium]|nr:adaptor protein MecA [Lachnospiraceae bacterium]